MFWFAVVFVLVVATSAAPAAVITSNNPHHAQHIAEVQTAVKQSSNRAPVTEWEALYEKEIGTWCAPADETTTTPATTTTTTTTTKSAPSVVKVDVAHQRPAGWQQIPSNETATLTRWVDAALRIIRSGQQQIPCDQGADDELCKRSRRSVLENRPIPSDMNLYVAMSAGGKQQSAKLSAVLPDGSLTKTGPRDAWIVLDPSPHLAFGHTVHVFAIDFQTVDSTCLANGGVPLGEFSSFFLGGDGVTVAVF